MCRHLFLSSTGFRVVLHFDSRFLEDLTCRCQSCTTTRWTEQAILFTWQTQPWFGEVSLSAAAAAATDRPLYSSRTPSPNWLILSTFRYHRHGSAAAAAAARIRRAHGNRFRRTDGRWAKRCRYCERRCAQSPHASVTVTTLPTTVRRTLTAAVAIGRRVRRPVSYSRSNRK